MTTFLDEAQVELVVLDILGELGWPRAFGPDIAFDGERPERTSYGDMVLVGRLREALARINPNVPEEAIEEAIRKVTRTESPSLVENNRRFHRMLTEGVPVEYHARDGRIVHEPVWLVDFADPDNNDWLAVNQFTVVEDRRNRRPDVVLFVNGLPLVVIELKNPADENATIKHAFNQFQTYKRDIPGLFTYNALLAISDGLEARLGTLTADWERFMPWRTIDGRDVAPASQPQLDVLLRGVFDRERLLDLIRFFIVFEDDGAKVVKKAAAYHQYHAVNKAVACTVQAAAPKGNRQIGVVWHTQGSGKSLSMAFYSGKIIQHPLMSNPTLVVLTDRNDLDDQLFGTFAACKDLLRQSPVQAESRSHLRELLSVAAGRRGLHHHPEVHAGDQGRQLPAAVRPAEHRGHRRRGPPQPVRLHRRLRPAPAGCRAQGRRSSASRARPSRATTAAPRPSSATTSTSTTSSGPSRTGPRCGSTTRAGWRRSSCWRTSGRRSTPSSRRSPRARKRTRSSSSRAAGPGWRRWSARRSGSPWSPRTW